MGKDKKFLEISSIHGGRDIIRRLEAEGVNSDYVVSYFIPKSHTGGEIRANFIPYGAFKERITDDVMVTQKDIRVKAYYLPQELSVKDTAFSVACKTLKSIIPNESFYSFERHSDMNYDDYTNISSFLLDNVSSIEGLNEGLFFERLRHYDGEPIMHNLVAKRLKNPKELSDKLMNLIAEGEVANNPHLAHLLK